MTKSLDRNHLPIILFDIDYTLFNVDLFKESVFKQFEIYGEVEGVLIELSSLARLGIFSEGGYELQKAKLARTNIKKYFRDEHTHIIFSKSNEIKKVLDRYKNKKIFFVDDKLTILHDAKKIMPSIFTIWVKRGKYAQGQAEIKNFKPDATITSLDQIISIVLSCKL